MSVNFIYDVSGSMAENKSLIYYYYYTLSNIKASYGIDFNQFLLAEELKEFDEPKSLAFGVKINSKEISKTLEDDAVVVLITDGCFSQKEKQSLEKEFGKRRFIFLLVGENANYQLVKKIARDSIYKMEDLFSCLNNLFPGVLI